MKKRHVLYMVIMGFLTTLLLINCDKEEPIPAYIYIDSITFKPAAGQGTASARITDAWVYVNEDIIGAFELPAMVPVLASGKVRVLIGSGVMVNGKTGNRQENIFYEAYTQEIALEPGKIDTLVPVVGYSRFTDLIYVDDFETGNSFAVSPVSQVSSFDNVRGTGVAFEGSNCMAFTVSDSFPRFNAQSSKTFNKKDADGQVFLEMNYKAENSFTVNVYIIDQSGQAADLPFVTFVPSDGQWRKVYVNLNNVLAQQPTGSKYKLSFESFKEDGSSGKVYIDNIKVMD
jgi:hypothetical protein